MYGSWRAERSAPAEKPRPSPVSTTARTSGSDPSVSMTSSSSAVIVGDSAFSRSGLLRRTVATAPRGSTMSCSYVLIAILGPSCPSRSGLPGCGREAPALHVALHENAPPHHPGRAVDLELTAALAIGDLGGPGGDGETISDERGRLVGEFDPMPGGVLVWAQVPLDQQPARLLDVPDHPRRGVDRMDLPPEQLRGHLGRHRHAAHDLVAEPGPLPHGDTMPQVQPGSETDDAARDGLSDSDLALRSGTSAERVRLLGRLGILRPAEDGSYRRVDINRIRLAEALDRSGISLEDLGRAIDEGHVSLDFLDHLWPEPAAFVPGRTIAEMARDHGLP